MKARCVEQHQDLASFHFHGELPKAGEVYFIEPAGSHTTQQRKAWHSLVQEWFKSGLWNYDTIDFHKFRDYIKKDYGAGFDRYKWVDECYNINESKALEEIPEYVLKAQAEGQTGRINGVLKSFSDYTKKEVMDSLDKVINAMMEAGVNSDKFAEILKGMNDE